MNVPQRPTRPPRRAIDGVLLLDKPVGLSSNHALQAAKRALWAEKAGHTGTLDPLASGLLPICFGEATKFSQTLLEADKAYRAEIRLGIRTDTADAEGQVIARCETLPGPAELNEALSRFIGPILQVPPMHSALKVQGKPLYAYARAGTTIERAARQVTIHHLRLLAFEGPTVTLEVACSKGTYIRTLADDLGATLGCGAHLSGLIRTRIGLFELDQAIGLDVLTRHTSPESALLPVDTLLSGLPAIELDSAAAQRILQGQTLVHPQTAKLVKAWVRLYSPSGFIGMGCIEAGRVVPLRLVRSGSGHPPTSI